MELYKRCDPKMGDILLTKVGTTGIPVIVDTDKEFSLFVSVAQLRFNHKFINPEYLKYLILSPLVQIQCSFNMSIRNIGNAVINMGKIYLLPTKNFSHRITIHRFIIIPDNDEAGFRGYKKIKEVMDTQGLKLKRRTISDTNLKDVADVYSKGNWNSFKTIMDKIKAKFYIS